MQFRHVHAGLVVVALALASCRSGGDGPPPGPSVSANITSISRTQSIADAAQTVTVRVTVANPPAGDLWADLEFSGTSVSFADWNSVSETVADVNVWLRTPGDLAPGTYTGSVRFQVCTNSTCTTQVQGSPITIPVELVVTAAPSITISANPAQINATTVMQSTGSPSPRETVTLTLSSPVQSLQVIQAAHSNTIIVNAWGSLTSPTTIELRVDFVSPDFYYVGTHTDTLQVTLCYTFPCVNPVVPTPVSIPVSYTIEVPGALPEPGIDPLAPSWTETLPHNVIDAEYSQALDAIVMISTYPANALYVYDVDMRTEAQVLLSKVPMSLSVGPDGLKTAVGHDALVTYIDLTQIGQAGDPKILLNISTAAFDVVVDGRGYVHAFPLFDQWEEMHSVEVATNTEYIGLGSILAQERAKLHPSGDYIYGVDTGSSPGDIEKFDIRTVPTTLLYDSPYHGTYEPCWNLWIAESGLHIYTACGVTFRASEIPADDLLYAGSLALTGPNQRIHALSQTDEQREIALIEGDYINCATYGAAALLCYMHLTLFESDFLNRTAVYSFAPITVAGKAYSQRGLFVFHSADGTRKFTVSRLYGIPNPNAEFYLSEL